MYFKTLLASAALLIASVTAQSSVTPTTSSPASTTTDLLGLVSQLPTCALGCLDEAATNINCTAPDLTCLCSKSSALVSSIGPCLLLSSGCSSNDTNKIGSLARDICSDVNSATSSELAAASRAVSSALATTTADSSTSSANVAMHTGAPIAGMGVLGFAAGLAVMAL